MLIISNAVFYKFLESLAEKNFFSGCIDRIYKMAALLSEFLRQVSGPWFHIGKGADVCWETEGKEADR